MLAFFFLQTRQLFSGCDAVRRSSTSSSYPANHMETHLSTLLSKTFGVEQSLVGCFLLLQVSVCNYSWFCSLWGRGNGVSTMQFLLTHAFSDIHICTYLYALRKIHTYMPTIMAVLYSFWKSSKLIGHSGNTDGLSKVLVSLIHEKTTTNKHSLSDFSRE